MTAQIQEVLQKMRADYIANLPRQLESLEAQVMALGKGDDYQDRYEELYRAIHSLKGTAGTYGIPVITAICGPFEEYLAATLKDVRGASNEQITACMHFIELLSKATRQVSAGRDTFPEIETSLAAI